MNSLSRRHFVSGLLLSSLHSPLWSKHKILRWYVIDPCRLVRWSYYDGDSFHMLDTKTKMVHHLRLYGADCPELESDETSERLQEQAAYFETSIPKLQEWAKAAKLRTATLTYQSVKIYTIGRDAQGQGKLPRRYAYVFTDEGSLSEVLIREGLARAHGYWDDFQGARWQELRARYQELEAEAKRAQIGIWSKT